MSTEPQDLGALARSIIESNRFMTLATADGTGLPWASPVWYAPVGDWVFLWVSDPQARHSRNLATRPQLAIVIFDPHEAGEWRSVYMSALAEQLEGAEAEEGIEIFAARSEAQGLRRWTRGDVVPPAKHRLYRATASEVFVLDQHDRRVPVDVS